MVIKPGDFVGSCTPAVSQLERVLYVAFRISFILRSLYDLLNSNTNVVKVGGCVDLDC